MNKFRQTCSLCGREAECTEVMFGRNAVNGKPFPVMKNNALIAQNVVRLYACDDCGHTRGKTPKSWIVNIISQIAIIVGLVLAIPAMGGSGRSMNAAGALGLMLTGVAWFVMLISGCVLVTKGDFTTGGAAGRAMMQMFPIVGLLVLLPSAQRINDTARAVSALKPEVDNLTRADQERDAEIAARLERGDLVSAEEKAAYEKRQSEQKAVEAEAQYMKAEQQERNRKGNIVYGILGLVITLMIMFRGISLYSSGTGYYRLFNSIDLSKGGFTVFIIVLLILDISYIVGAVRRK